MWRIEKPTEGGSLEIKNNVFCNAPFGAAVYSIISEDAEAQMHFKNNVYFTENPELLIHFGGKDYKSLDGFAEKDAVYKEREELKL